MTRLTNVFNYAAVPLYLAGEALQRLSAGVRSCINFDGLLEKTLGVDAACRAFFDVVGAGGFDVYQMFPAGGQEMRYYFSGFWGAVALNFLANEFYPLAGKHLPESVNRVKTELCGAFSLAALGYWELSHINTGFDWKDMVVYSAAVGLSYGLHKLTAKTSLPSPHALNSV